jgi:response regulator of citrate/malate metabolism
MASPNIRREAIIQAGGRISRLREELARAEAQLDELISGTTSESSTDPSSEDKSLNQRLVDFLDANTQQDYDAEDLAKALDHSNLTTIRSALARLSDGKNDRIKRTSRGRYASLKRTSFLELIGAS